MGKIIVLGGGTSNERDVSLRSASSVQNALNQAGYETIFLDPSESKDYLYASKDEIVFPILHGEFGEDGELQKLLENNNIAFLGSTSSSSENSFDKILTRNILSKTNIQVPKGELVYLNEYPKHPLTQRPHVAKVAKGGSSIGTFIQRNGRPLEEKILNKEFSNQKILIEELIDGVEVTVPILDSIALPVIEIQPPIDGEFDYENKYNGKTKELCPSSSISAKKQTEIQRLAERVHEIMNCRHLSRVDIIIDSSGTPYVLEINTMPGMTEQSLFPLAAKTSGISMPELVSRFYDMVVRDSLR